MKLQFDRKLPDKRVILKVPGLTAELLDQYLKFQKEQHEGLHDLTVEEVVVRLLDTFLTSTTEAAWNAWRKRKAQAPKGKAKVSNGDVLSLDTTKTLER